MWYTNPMPGNAYLLGIDASFRKIGLACLNLQTNRYSTLKIASHKSMKGDEVLGYNRLQFELFLAGKNITQAVIEDYSLESEHNITILAESAGVIKSCLAVLKYPCKAVSPMQVKLAIADHGHASKDLVMQHVSARYFPVTDYDISDATACLHVARLLSKNLLPMTRGEHEVLNKITAIPVKKSRTPIKFPEI